VQHGDNWYAAVFDPVEDVMAGAGSQKTRRSIDVGDHAWVAAVAVGTNEDVSFGTASVREIELDDLIPIFEGNKSVCEV